MVVVPFAAAACPIPISDMSVLCLGVLQSLNPRGLQPGIARKDEIGASFAFMNINYWSPVTPAQTQQPSRTCAGRGNLQSVEFPREGQEPLLLSKGSHSLLRTRLLHYTSHYTIHYLSGNTHPFEFQGELSKRITRFPTHPHSSV